MVRPIIIILTKIKKDIEYNPKDTKTREGGWIVF
jgi:hypothetical protein